MIVENPLTPTEFQARTRNRYLVPFDSRVTVWVVAARSTSTPARSRQTSSAFIRHVAQSIERRNERAVQALRIEKERDPDLHAYLREHFLTPRLANLKAILTRAKRRGEIDTVPPVDVALSLVTGPLYHRAYHLDEPLTPAFVKNTIAFAVRALHA